ncbi:PTS glucose transporter subunit IIA [Kocuria palustris]|uniref:PTS sugar transporter subunit IIA n=1 Tax=Kocuria palustris TaxID=71999 RepID=UPI00119F947C|nr:PTS glucose transporter subunit IIA [Kocuria palustris]
MSLEIRAPFAGRVLPLDQVPDPVFAQGMVGTGLALLPADDAATIEVLAPAAGTVLKAMPHAIALIAQDGTGVLVHVGLDTVGLKGRGLEVLVEKKQRVEPGDPVLRVDAAVVREAGLSLCTPVVAMDAGPERLDRPAAAGSQLGSLDPLFALHPGS